MFVTKLTFGCVLLSLLNPTTALAQRSGDYGAPPPIDFRPVSPWPTSMGESYDHDSTAAGNYLRNLAGVIHASGNYWLSRSQATILLEYSRSLEKYNRPTLGRVLQRQLATARGRAASMPGGLRAKNEANRPEKYRAAYQLRTKN